MGERVGDTGKATMIAFQSPRLAALFDNTPLERLTADDIERAVQRGVLREDEDLDFKRRLPVNTEGAKAEFAKDVAAFANARGGLLLVGVGETEGVADKVELVDLDDDFQARLYGAAANWIAPGAEFGIHFAATIADPKRGYYLITIPRSPSAPHAVRVLNANDAWRFPRRVGSNTRFMSESEVADAYRSRFRGMEEQSGRLTTVLGNGQVRLKSSEAWAFMALVPNAQGRLMLDRKKVKALATWADRVPGIPPTNGLFSRANVLNASTRAGRVTLSAHRGVEAAEERPYAELYADGSGFAATPMPRPWTADRKPGLPIVAAELVRSTYGLVSLLVGHATGNVALVGDAVCAFELRSAAEPEGKKPMMLCFPFQGSLEQVRESRLLISAPVSQRTVSLSALMHSAQERVATTHMLLSDVFGEFGVPEGRYLAPDGTLHLRMWQLAEETQAQVEAWAQQHGVPTSFENIDE
jgi:hypothetical protein